MTRGALTFRRARLGAVTPTSGDIEVELIDRRRGVTTREHFDRVLLAVGPAHRGILASQPLFAALHAEGALTMDPTGLGLAVVSQNVLAHGWEISCLGNEPHGAIFRISHLRLVP